MIERLTYREELGVVLVKGVDEKRCHVHCTEKRHSGDIAEDCMNCEINKAFERLAEYEDTKLSPKAIIELNDFEKTQCAKLLAKLGEYINSGLSPEEVQELAKAKADGRLVELPCKVGDTVWKIKSVFSYFSKPMEDRVDRIIISNNEILACCTSGTKFSIGIIGKTVFLTREEAEKALEGSE